MSLPITAIEATDETIPATTDVEVLEDLERRVERLESVVTSQKALDVDVLNVLAETMEFLAWLKNNGAFRPNGDTYKHIEYLLEKADAIKEGRQARFEGF